MLQKIGVFVLVILIFVLISLGMAWLASLAWNAVLGPRLFVVTVWEMWLLIFLANLFFGTIGRSTSK
jgi:hypothetical protein